MFEEDDQYYKIDKNLVSKEKLSKLFQKKTRTSKFQITDVTNISKKSPYVVTEPDGSFHNFTKICDISKAYSIPNSSTYRLIEGYKVKGIEITIERNTDVYSFTYKDVNYSGESFKIISEKSNININNVYKIFSPLG